MYLVKIKIGDVLQFYALNDGKVLDLIEGLDHEVPGTCCGQTQCYACMVGGVRIRYIDHMETHDSEELLRFINNKHIYGLDELLDFVSRPKVISDRRKR
jgi:hypothetical protein